jgi:hypothetical protein
MKNLIKASIFSFFIATTFSACSGNNSTHVPDSARVDTPVSKTNPSGGGAEVNGAPGAIDSGMDNSSSGGTDTLKQGRKRKEFDR